MRVGDARVTRGLTIHCDLLLSNNLEVNWGGNQFHMTEHLTTVACTDDPAIIQAPPPAPLDTLIGVGTGRYNGDDGYTIEFTLVDYGEPGRSDQAALRIYETANPANVVLDVPLQLLAGGNLQAHYDQPHKRPPPAFDPRTLQASGAAPRRGAAPWFARDRLIARFVDDLFGRAFALTGVRRDVH